MTNNDAYRELTNEVHNLGAIISGLLDVMAAGVIRLPESMKMAIGHGASFHQQISTYPPEGIYWVTYIGPDAFSLQLKGYSGMLLQEWRNPIQWVPDVEIPGTKAWHNIHG